MMLHANMLPRQSIIIKEEIRVKYLFIKAKVIRHKIIQIIETGIAFLVVHIWLYLHMDDEFFHGQKI